MLFRNWTIYLENYIDSLKIREENSNDFFSFNLVNKLIVLKVILIKHIKKNKKKIKLILIILKI